MLEKFVINLSSTCCCSNLNKCAPLEAEPRTGVGYVYVRTILDNTERTSLLQVDNIAHTLDG